MSLLDWAKSGGMEGFSLRGALRLPSFKVNASNTFNLPLSIDAFIHTNYMFLFD